MRLGTTQSTTTSTIESASIPEQLTTAQSSGSVESAQQPLLVVRDQSASPPYQVQLQVNSQPLTMEVDTGAAVSLAPESDVAALLPSAELKPSSIILKTYTGEQIPVKGEMSVTVHYGQQTYANLKLLVVQGIGPSLMGRDWLRVVRLDWCNIAKVTSSAPSAANLASKVAALQDRYQEVFTETLGTITPFLAKLRGYTQVFQATPRTFCHQSQSGERVGSPKPRWCVGESPV